jgi:hypothetical protein
VKVEAGQLRWWAEGYGYAGEGPFVILEHSPVGAGAWWILTSKGRDWAPHEMIEELSEVISEG